MGRMGSRANEGELDLEVLLTAHGLLETWSRAI